jgi:flagellar biosynthetic protein FliQ
MTENMLMSVLKDGIITGLMVAAPFLTVAVVVGLFVSIIQATTQIQEQTLTFVPKLLSIAAVGVLLGAWILHTMTGFTLRIFDMITNITR